MSVMCLGWLLSAEQSGEWMLGVFLPYLWCYLEIKNIHLDCNYIYDRSRVLVIICMTEKIDKTVYFVSPCIELSITASCKYSE